MAEDKRIKQLHRLRGALKAKLTILDKFLKKPVADIDLIELKGKRIDAERVKTDFETTQNEIESLVSDAQIDSEYAERIDFEERLSSLIAQAERAVKEKEPVSQTDLRGVSHNSGSSGSNANFQNNSQIAVQSHENSINLKLPALNLPSFSGTYEKWPGFSDTFKSSVHSDRRYTDSQKLVYLRSCLTGKAADKIESLETTDANYQVAWDILEKYYNDPAAVINNHVKAFFELPNCQNTSANVLGDLLNAVTKHYRALEALKQPFLEAFPIYAITSKLDPQTRLKWKEHIQGDNSPTMELLLEFLHCREKLLETNKTCSKNEKFEKNVFQRKENQHRDGNRSRNQLHINRAFSYATQYRAFCHICKDAHFTQNCEKLLNANVQERIDIVKNSNLCFNCLRSNHTVENCKAKMCKTCNKKHHTLLHRESNEPKPNIQTNLACLHNATNSQVLLSTAMIHILDHKGNPHACRALLDNGSQVHFMTEKMAAKLKLNQNEIEIPLGGVNQMSSSISKITRTTIQSRFNTYCADLTFLITPEINPFAPSERIDRVQLKVPSNLYLADPEFHKPGKIDALIGAEIFLQLLCNGQVSLANDNAILQKTKLGWILGGKTSEFTFPSVARCNLSLNLLNRNIEKFWELEHCPQASRLSKEEIACEDHYQENTYRDQYSGKYCVKLPFKENEPVLGESYSNALKRLYATERSFDKKPHLKEPYIENLKSYIENDHMSESNSKSIHDGYFLPHHAVIKQSSLTTKVRVVFDASAKTSNGKSLNDTLMVGPNIQEKLFPLLIRFRSHAYALTADIEKMFRQIQVHPDDRKFLKILWRETTDQPVKIFTLNTVTFGTAPASFLATRTLVQLADDEANSYPHASVALKEDFYMDDLVSGAKTREEASQLISELINTTHKAGMNLRQWASNDPSLIESLSESSNDSFLCLNLGEKTKTLGIYWDPKPDLLLYTVNQANIINTVTKRSILSQIAQLFDPLGLLGPVILKAKIIMQSLWKLKLDWDDSVPSPIREDWIEFHNQLSLLEGFTVQRKIVGDDCADLEIHGFCDASKKAYGACLYIRSIGRNSVVTTQLICSKSRVAPLDVEDVCRLELCSALLLVNLFSTVNQALRRLNIQKTIFWSDSMIALNWIKKASHTLPTFEANRVAKIQALSIPHEWRHVATEHNPADLVSRGLSPREIIDNSFWLNGPVWINKSEEEWPESKFENLKLPAKLAINVNVVYENKVVTRIFENAKTFTDLKRTVAYWQRFIRFKTLKQKVLGYLTSIDLQRAHTRIIKIVQHQAFSNEIEMLKSKQILKGNLTALAPFLDAEGMLRVGGRLNQSEFSYSRKHPILMPQNHIITNLIIREKHLNLFHAGTQATLNACRELYWIVNGKNSVKRTIRQCVICCRAKPQIPNYVMGDLPKNRTIFKRAFLQSGVDFCGPFYIKEKKFRNRNKIKIYVCIFVCFATKAVHIEIVSDLTSEAFLACLSRFFSRRGKSSDLYCDNATNFIGAKNELAKISEFLRSQKVNSTISRVLANHHINWHFIPPRSPHFGGLWEAAVKSFKYHLVRVIGNQLLTYEQFTTLATEIEAILNSRPLTPLPSDPNDLAALSPGHFLIGDSLTGMPEQDLMGLPSGRLSSWQRVQQMKQHFWTRWSKEYLNELTVRKKWHQGTTNDIKIGQIVTLRDDKLPPMQWSLGRVIATHPGADEIVRVVTVRTALGEYKRSVKLISPLPIEI